MSKKMEKATENAIFLEGRGYTAADLYRLIGLLVGNGVYANELAPTATNENMSITHGTGHAWIGGVAYWNTTPFVVDVPTADGSLNRYDSLMLRRDLSNNEVYATLVQGEFATAPTPPDCTRNAEIFDLKICDVYVPAGCTKITQAQIIDRRLDSSVCGVPVFPVEHLDMTTFYQQITADLANFRQDSVSEVLDLLEQLNDLVDGDTVGKLVAEINCKLSKTGGDMEGSINMNGESITGLNDPKDSTDAARKSYVDKMSAPVNLLDNSDFTQFIAQAGIGGAHDNADAYAGDRWILDAGEVTGTENSNGNGYSGITLNGTIRQKLPAVPDICTVGVSMVSGTADISYADGEVTITSAGGVIRNAWCYPAEYAADCVPAYRPKGYAAELMECKRYYYNSTTVTEGRWNIANVDSRGYVMILIPVGITMRVSPSRVYTSHMQIYGSLGWQDIDETAVAINVVASNGYYYLQFRTDSLSDITLEFGNSYLVRLLPALSADL